jgi:hypothetical protein
MLLQLLMKLQPVLLPLLLPELPPPLLLLLLGCGIQGVRPLKARHSRQT